MIQAEGGPLVQVMQHGELQMTYVGKPGDPNRLYNDCSLHPDSSS